MISNYDRTKVWRTQNGRLLRPQDFDDHHLLATIKFIRERSHQWVSPADLDLLRVYSVMPNGEHAYDAAQQEFTEILDGKSDWVIEKRFPIFKKLRVEARRRGLQELDS